jgi:organic hydroperoxide reductase OsmC/OhrA
VSQVATKKKLVLRDERVKVTAHFRESGSVLDGTKAGSCQGFEIELSIESDAAPEDVAELIRLAHRMCFTEDALSGVVELTKTHRLNGRPIESGANSA